MDIEAQLSLLLSRTLSCDHIRLTLYFNLSLSEVRLLHRSFADKLRLFSASSRAWRCWVCNHAARTDVRLSNVKTMIPQNRTPPKIIGKNKSNCRPRCWLIVLNFYFCTSDFGIDLYHVFKGRWTTNDSPKLWARNLFGHLFATFPHIDVSIHFGCPSAPFWIPLASL